MATRAPEDTAWYGRDGSEDTTDDKLARANALFEAADALERGDLDAQAVDDAVDVLRDWAAYGEHELGEDATPIDNLADEVEAGSSDENTLDQLRDRAGQLQIHAMLTA